MWSAMTIGSDLSLSSVMIKMLRGTKLEENLLLHKIILQKQEAERVRRGETLLPDPS